MSSSVNIQKPRDPGIQLTPAALRHIEKFIAKQGGIGLRLSLSKTGCSGLSYDVTLLSEVPEGDHWVSPITPTIAVYVATDAVPHVRGTIIDYVKEGLNAHFNFNNPNEDSRCGCGESFTVKTED